MSRDSNRDSVIAYLSVQVPRSVNEPYSPGWTPIVVEATASGKRIQIFADGRYTAVPAGLVYLIAKPRYAASVTVALELEAGEVRDYRFGKNMFSEFVPTAFVLTNVAKSLRGRKGVIHVRFLEGPRFVPTQLTHIVSSALDGGLMIQFRGKIVAPLIAEIVAVGQPRTFLCLSPKAGPSKSYTSVKLSLERYNSSVTFSASDINHQLASAWRFAVAGNHEEALEIIQPLLHSYSDQEFIESSDAAGVAYILIRAGAWDELRKLVPSLLNSAEVSADSLIAASEWFAHEGCHLSAINLLKQIPLVGLPLFSDGLSLSIARLAAYAATQFSGRSIRVSFSRERSKPKSKLGQADSFRKLQNEMLLDAKTEGQKVMPWNSSEARRVHQYLVCRSGDIDWSSYVLKFSRDRNDLAAAIGAVSDWLSTRVLRDWTAIEWQLPSENTTREV